MNVTGLSNLGLSQPANNAGGAKASGGKDKPSFESFLARSQNAKPEAPTARHTGPVTPERKFDQPTDSQSEGQSGQREREPAPNPQAHSSPAPLSAKAKTASAKSEPSATKDSERAAVASNSTLPPHVPTPETPPAVPTGEDAEVSATSMEGAEVMAPVVPGPALNGAPLAERPLGNPAAVALAAGASKTAPPVTKEDPTNSLTRRVVWNDFLRKMNDIGVTAEDVLNAFATLSDKDLAQPPDQSVDKVVMALGLDGQQATLARQYFHELIQKTQSRSLGEELAASHKQISLTMMSQLEMEKNNLSNSLDRMNGNFFMNQRHAMQAGLEGPGAEGQAANERIAGPFEPLNEQAGMQERMMPEALGFPALSPLTAPGMSTLAPQATEASAASMSLRAANRPPPANVNELINQMREIPTGDKKALEQLVKNFNLRQAAGALPNPAAYAPAPASSAPTLGGAGTAVTAPVGASAGALAALNGIFAGSGNRNSQDGDESGEDSHRMATFDSAAMVDNRSGPGAQVKGEFQAQLAQGPAAPHVMSVPDLVQQAHIMVKDGGGEMKVTLRPEGLGEVAMRVTVNDGRVNVQMITESDAAKRLIEHQIGDLKSSLNANHLQVDSIKVDTASNLGKQLEQQYQDAQRQQTHQSMEQFRQDTGGWKRSFFETGTVNPYGGQAGLPRDTQAPASAKAKRSGERRLDLVA